MMKSYSTRTEILGLVVACAMTVGSSSDAFAGTVKGVMLRPL